jgi:formylmethanofuran dehydrogenase subunit E
MQKIGCYTFEEYCERVRAFHGALAPGILVGGFMVEMARRNLPENTLFDVISETVECLPDAVQLLTPCSVGNQWLRIIDVGRFAVTLYDKDTGEGARVHLDSAKLEAWPAINEWFMKLKPKKQQDRDRLVEEIRTAGTDICTIERMTVRADFLRGTHQKSVSVCPICNEAYRGEEGPVCPVCNGRSLPYAVRPPSPSRELQHQAKGER